MTHVRFRFEGRQAEDVPAPLTKKGLHAAVRIGDGRLWMGSIKAAECRSFLASAGVALVVMIASEDDSEVPDFYKDAGIVCIRVPAWHVSHNDLMYAVMERGEFYQHVSDALVAGGAVLVASPDGGSQGAAAFCAGMLLRDNPSRYPTLDAAVVAVREASPIAMVPHATFSRALRAYATHLGCSQCANHVPERCSTVSGATSFRPPRASRPPRGSHPACRM